MDLKRFLENGIASFMLDGEIYPVVPVRMRREGDVLVTEKGDIRVTLELREFSEAGTEGLSWVVRLTNTGDAVSPRLTHLCGLDVRFPCEKALTLHRLLGDSNGADSFMPEEVPLAGNEKYTFAPTGGRSSNTSAFPFFDLTADGEVLETALGWSGQWTATVIRTADCARLTAGQQYLDTVLEPGESVRSVRILLASNSGGEWANRHAFRELIRRRFSPYARLGEETLPPIAIQVFDRYYWNNTEGFRNAPQQLRIIEAGKRSKHFNTFWLDAMWFRDAFPTGVGNYELAPEFGKSLKPISDAAHDAGMRFMVWFEPERIDIGSDTFKEFGSDPDFLLDAEPHGGNGIQAVGGRNRLLNLGNPKALEWITGTVIRFIRENGIDIYREDFNIDPLAYWLAHDTPGRTGMTEMRAVEGLYAFWDAITAAYPHMLIDNCSSGGRRIDLETVTRAIPCWRSDTTCSREGPERRITVWAQNQNVNLSRYLPYQQSASWEPRAYETRSGLTDGMAAAFDMCAGDYDADAAAAALAEVIRLRPYRRGAFRQISEPTLREDVWFAYGMSLPGSGFALAFRRDGCAEEDYVLKLDWLEPEARYRVVITGEGLCSRTEGFTGAQLIGGIRLHTDAPRSSVLAEYEKL